jgi:hypothetical protein
MPYQIRASKIGSTLTRDVADEREAVGCVLDLTADGYILHITDRETGAEVDEADLFEAVARESGA